MDSKVGLFGHERNKVKSTSKKVPALTQGFEWAYVPGVELYSAREQDKRHFLPRITHTVPGCATIANCILEFPQTHINARFLSPTRNKSVISISHSFN